MMRLVLPSSNTPLVTAALVLHEQVYRELHGVLGEGKGHIQSGLAVALFLLNTTARSTIIDRLRVRAHLFSSSSCVRDH
jgi:hypothetical protein